MNIVELLEKTAEKNCKLNLDNLAYSRIGKRVEQSSSVLTEDEKRDLLSKLNDKMTFTEAKNVLEESFNSKNSIEFIPSSSIVDIKNISFHSSRGNISLKYKQDGHINLEKDHPASIEDPFPTYILRNISIVRDGKLNVSLLPIIPCRELFEDLKSNGIDLGEWEEGKTYTIDLEKMDLISSIPISERSYFKMVYSLFSYKLRKKALEKFLLDVESSKISPLIEKYSIDGSIYLKKLGITEQGCFSPSVVERKAESSYTGKEIYYRIYGMSELPSYKELEDKIFSQKKMNNADMLLLKFRNECLNNQASMGYAEFVSWLRSELESAENFIRTLSASLAQVRLSWLNSEDWMNSHSEVKDFICELDGRPIACKLGWKETKFYL